MKMGQIYKHYKGGEYVFLTEALRESDRENMVVYRCLDTNFTYVRPEEEFLSKFEKISEEKLIGVNKYETGKVYKDYKNDLCTLLCYTMPEGFACTYAVYISHTDNGCRAITVKNFEERFKPSFNYLPLAIVKEVPMNNYDKPTTNLYDGKPDERQGDETVKTSRFRPRYRALTVEEKDLHDLIKTKAVELERLFNDVKPGRYSSLAITSLEESIMWIVKELTA